MGWDTHFEFQTFKQQIEKFALNQIRLWEEDKIYNYNCGRKIPEKPFAILLKIELYNKIREIYNCDIPFPKNTPELFGFIIGIDTRIHSRGAYVVNKKEYLKLKNETQRS